MEMQRVRIVNKSMGGEAEHACLQNISTNSIYEFSKIVDENIIDGDLSHPIIQSILNNGHEVNITLDEIDNITLQF